MRRVYCFVLLACAVVLSACGVDVRFDEPAASTVDAAVPATVSTTPAAPSPSPAPSAATSVPASPEPRASSAPAASPSGPGASASEGTPAAAISSAEAQPSQAAEGSASAQGEVIEGSAPAEVVEGEGATSACPNPQPIAAGETQPVVQTAAPPALLLILDSSGSMLEDDGTGRRKIDAAKDALTTLVDSLPDGAPVGLRVYGHRFPNTDKANGCTDTELIAPIAPLDKAAMNARIASFDANGFTPIATSLQAAATDLPPEGERTIVLVSDGEETCDRDPCQVARELAAAGIDVAVETVGFQVDDATRTQLECIAEATGGQYHDAADATQLAATLQQISTRALRTYQTRGAAVQGGDSPQRATLLGPGQYTDTISAGRTLYYAVELQAGQRLDIAATVLAQPDISQIAAAGVPLELKLLAPDGEQLEFDLGEVSADNETAVVRSQPVEQAGRYVVEYDFRADVSDEFAARLYQTEILVRVDGQACTPILAVQNPGPVQGSGDFNSAPVLTGGTYQDAFQINESVYYAVWLNPGQGVRASATLASRPDVSDAQLGPTVLWMWLYSPMRDELKNTSERPFIMDVKQVAVEFPSVAEAGLYYVEVKLEEYTRQLEGIEFGFDLAIEIVD